MIRHQLRNLPATIGCENGGVESLSSNSSPSGPGPCHRGPDHLDSDSSQPRGPVPYPISWPAGLPAPFLRVALQGTFRAADERLMPRSAVWACFGESCGSAVCVRRTGPSTHDLRFRFFLSIRTHALRFCGRIWLNTLPDRGEVKRRLGWFRVGSLRRRLVRVSMGLSIANRLLPPA
jgi:hypothetical protein